MGISRLTITEQQVDDNRWLYHIDKKIFGKSVQMKEADFEGISEALAYEFSEFEVEE